MPSICNKPLGKIHFRLGQSETLKALQSHLMLKRDGHMTDMNSQRITDKLVRGLLPPIVGNQMLVRDNLVSGFAVRITKTGFVSFVINYVSNGVQRRLTIGSPPAWSVSAAREEAKRLRRLADIGHDPIIERRRARAEQTLSQVWKRYETEVLAARAEKTQENVKSIWNRLIKPTLGSKRLSSILPQDIDRLHREVSKKTPTQSNRMLATLQHLFSKAIRWQLVTINPVKGVERNQEIHRERFLSEEELGRLVRVLDQKNQTPSILAIKFLLLTGARSGETFKAKWKEFDLTKGIWNKPRSNTKSGKSHRVPLAQEAIAVLIRAQSNRKNEYVFSGRYEGHLTTIKTVFSSVLMEAQIHDLRVHDLRHSYASLLLEQGVALVVIGRMLGHSQLVTTSRYAHLVDRDLRSAANLIGKKVKKHGEK